jgi:hypothetical protein
MSVTDTATTVQRPTRSEWAAVPKVNLLPPEIIEARRFAGLQRRLVLLVLVAVVGCAAATGWAQGRVSAAQGELDAARGRIGVLQAEKAKYAEVPKVTAAVDAALTTRQQAMAADVLWYRYLNDLALATSSSTWLSSMTATLTGSVPAPGSDPLSPPGIGTLAISGQTTSLPNVGVWLEALDGITGVKGSTLVAATREGLADAGGAVTFGTTSVLTTDALSHRYDRKAS